jgi:hypothetical protein
MPDRRREQTEQRRQAGARENCYRPLTYGAWVTVDYSPPDRLGYWRVGRARWLGSGAARDLRQGPPSTWRRDTGLPAQDVGRVKCKSVRSFRHPQCPALAHPSRALRGENGPIFFGISVPFFYFLLFLYYLGNSIISMKIWQSVMGNDRLGFYTICFLLGGKIQ